MVCFSSFVMVSSASFSENVKKMGLKNSAEIIADEVIKLIKG